MSNSYMGMTGCKLPLIEQPSCSSINSKTKCKTFSLSSSKESEVRRDFRSRKSWLPSLFGMQRLHKWTPSWSHWTVADLTPSHSSGLTPRTVVEFTFASKLIPCWNASSLCSGILKSCPSSTRLYFVFPGISTQSSKCCLFPKSERGRSLLLCSHAVK